MSTKITFTKDNLDNYLKALGKEFRKRNGKVTPAEIVLIGGASILVNYGFRENTYDVDAIIKASSVMKEAIHIVGDSYNLPNGWLNSDFTMTKSYTPKLLQYSKYYKTFSNVLTIRTVTAEYLIAMKLMSGRQYKNDLSDIIGILLEEQKKGNELTYEDIEKSVINLYDSWENLPKDSQKFIKKIFESHNLEELYLKYQDNERDAKKSLVEFEEDYPGVVKEDNLKDVLSILKTKKGL